MPRLLKGDAPAAGGCIGQVREESRRLRECLVFPGLKPTPHLPRLPCHPSAAAQVGDYFSVRTKRMPILIWLIPPQPRSATMYEAAQLPEASRTEWLF